MIRNIIKIDEELCTGCGECVIGCPEGAIQIIDGKAKLVSENYCDGLGACIGDCPEGAISIERRESEPYDEKNVMDEIVKKGQDVILAHLEHLKNHNENDLVTQALDYLKRNKIEIPENFQEPEHQCGFQCPGMKPIDITNENESSPGINKRTATSSNLHSSEISNWPIQIKLMPIEASYLKNSDILIAADCTAAASPNFHPKFVKNKVLMMGCPKLDDADDYIQKLSHIFERNHIRSVTILMMTVPCCRGLQMIIDRALEISGKSNTIPFQTDVIDIRGEQIR